jgi:hypothetical protein
VVNIIRFTERQNIYECMRKHGAKLAIIIREWLLRRGSGSPLDFYMEVPEARVCSRSNISSTFWALWRIGLLKKVGRSGHKVLYAVDETMLSHRCWYEVWNCYRAGLHEEVGEGGGQA